MQMIEAFGWAVVMMDVDGVDQATSIVVPDRTDEIVSALRGLAGEREAVVFQKDMSGMQLAESAKGEYKPRVSGSEKALRILVV